MTPTLELTFQDVAGDPWEGQAMARFQGEPSGPFPVREGVSARQRGDIRWYIEEYLDLPEGGNAVRAAKVEAELAAYGQRLWEGLSAAGPLKAWLGAVQVARSGRLELRAATPLDEAAFRAPWELLRVGAAGSGGRLLHQLGVTVVRRVNADLPRLQAPDTSEGLRVLAIVCRPEEAGFLDPRYTPEAILDALAGRPEVSVEFARPGTLAALVDALEVALQEKNPYHVVHFDGHGTTLPLEGGIGALCFEDEKGGLDLVRATELGDLLSRFDVPLVVLEACRTATKSFAQDTVAGALLRQGVGTVLAMGQAVHVDMTRELMAAFYAGIARGWPLGEALQAARNQLYSKQRRRTRIAADAPTVNLQDWFVPQLYQGGEDPTLLSKKPSRRKRRPEPPLTGFPSAPRAGFQGRGHELHRLERAVLSHPAVVVHAPGGMGKTALAREAAHWWTRTGMFPDGAMFVSLEGNPSPERVVALVGDALEGPEFHKRKDPAAWIEDQLAQCRMLLVWDNYESVLPAWNEGRPALKEFADLARRWTAGGSRLLVTCRDREVGLEAWPFALGELNKVEGLMLLVGYLDRLGFDRAKREERGWSVEDFEPIVVKTGGHPLALELLAPQIPKLGPARVADELGEILGRIEQDSPEGRNRSMWASLDFSIRHLSEQARAALPAVALLAGGCLEEMAQMVVGLEPEAWREVRGELERTGLVRVEGLFFRPHPVLGELEQVSALAQADEEVHTAHIAEERFLAVVMAFAREFDKRVRSRNARVNLAVMAETEAVFRRAIECARAAGRMDAAYAVAGSLKMFLEVTGRRGEGAALMTGLQQQMGAAEGEITAVGAAMAREAAWAHAAGDPAGAARELEALLGKLHTISAWDTAGERALAFTTLGRVHYNFARRPTQAIQPLEQAIDLFSQVEAAGRLNSSNRSATMGDLANVFSDLGRFAEALHAAERSLVLDRARNDRFAAARGECQVGQILDDQGRYAEAEQRYRRALAEAEEVGDDELAGILGQSLGVLLLVCNRPEEAIRWLHMALAASQREGNQRGQMKVLNALGSAEARRGQFEAAVAWYGQSLALATQLNDVGSQAIARGNRAILLAQRAEEIADPQERRLVRNQAIIEKREVLALVEQFGQPATTATTCSNLADSLRLAGQLDEAEEYALQALALRESLRAPDTWRTLRILEGIAEARGDATAAADYRRRKEEARGEAQARAGTPPLPQEAVASLLQLAHFARGKELPLGDALSSAGVEDPAAFFSGLRKNYPWLSVHLHALAGGAPRPAADVPAAYTELLDAAWEAAAG